MKNIVYSILILVGMLCQAASAADHEVDPAEEGAEKAGPDIAVEESELAAPTEMMTKPDTFDSWGDRFDFIHNNFHLYVNHTVDRVDTYFVEDGAKAVETPPSRFRLGMYVELEVDSGVSFGLDPDYDIEVELPNLEQRWHVIVTGKDVSDLPGTLPTERDAGASVGVQNGLKKLHVRYGAGIKVKWPPVLYGELMWVPVWSAGSWRFHPQIKGYYKTDEKFGNLNSLMFYRWFGRHDRGIIRSTSTARWTEETDGVVGEQILVLGYVPQLLQRKSLKRNISGHDTARAIGLRAAARGHKSGEGVMDNYRFGVLFRFPLYKNYIFGEIFPEIEWDDDNDWDPTQRITLGVDLLFWGVGPDHR